MDRHEAKPFCLIPARGGSKRLPGKNIMPLSGKPLLAWTIEGALEARIFDEVRVSSEDEEILRVAAQWGAVPLRRDPDLAGDQVTVVTLCLSILREFPAARRGYSALYVMLPTSPFRRSETIRRAWASYVESGADTLLSVVPLEHPPQWALTENEGWLLPQDPDRYELSRQELPPACRHDGGHAIADIPRFLESPAFLGPRTLAFPVTPEEAVDIDDATDFSWAEFLLEKGRVPWTTR